MAKEQLYIEVTDKGTAKGHTANIKGAEEATRSMTKSVSLLAAGYVAIKAVKMGVELAQQAAKAQDVSKAFTNLAKSAGVDAIGTLNKMKIATAGTIDELQLMQKFSAAALLGLPLDRFDEMLAIARGASAATGESMEFMLNSIVTGLGRGSKLMLDNLGIMIDVNKANEDYAATLGKTARELTDVERKQAFINKALDIGSANLAKVGDTSNLASDAYGRLEANTKNLAIAIGTKLNPIISTSSGILADVAASVTKILTGTPEGEKGDDKEETRQSRITDAIARRAEATKVLTSRNFELMDKIARLNIITEAGVKLSVTRQKDLEEYNSEIARNTRIIEENNRRNKIMEEHLLAVDAAVAAAGQRMSGATEITEDLWLGTLKLSNAIKESAANWQAMADAAGAATEITLEEWEAIIQAQIDAKTAGEDYWENTLDIATSTTDALMGLSNNLAAYQIQNINQVETKSLSTAATKRAADIKLAKDTIENEAKLADTLAKIEADYQTEVLDAKEKARKDEAKARKAQKPYMIAQAIAGTALGITQALSSTKNAIVNMALAIVVGAAGAVQVATIAAQKFAKGGITKPGLSIVGEKGPELAQFPAGTRIFSNDQSKEMMGGSTVNNYYDIQIQTAMLDETVIDQIEPRLVAMIQRGQSQLSIQ